MVTISSSLLLDEEVLEKKNVEKNKNVKKLIEIPCMISSSYSYTRYKRI